MKRLEVDEEEEDRHAARDTIVPRTVPEVPSTHTGESNFDRTGSDALTPRYPVFAPPLSSRYGTYKTVNA